MIFCAYLLLIPKLIEKAFGIKFLLTPQILKMKSFFVQVKTLVMNTVKGFQDDRLMKMSAALAYHTIFALPPMLIIIISVAGLFFGEAAIRGKLIDQIGSVVGSDAAEQIQATLANISMSGKSGKAAVIAVGILLFGATRVFADMQDSINFIWQIKVKPKRGYLKMALDRVLSFSMVIVIGFLVTVSLLLNALLAALYTYIAHLLPFASFYLLEVINLSITFFTILVLFTITFKYLPDANVPLKYCWVGAAFTAILFILGNLGLTIYLSKSDLGSVYGASGSLIVLLVWIYYSAVTLFLGAEFTKQYVLLKGDQIEPKSYATLIERKEVEEN